ncbi:HD domain-containing protein [Pedobacter jamesrossensis]
MRTFLFGLLNAEQKKVKYDPELYYVCSAFHDLGLRPHYSSPDKRFEVDGANAARDFLKSHGLPEKSLQLAWDAIALHTSPGIAEYKEPEVAMLNYATALDVVGRGYDDLPPADRTDILKVFPRMNLKNQMIQTFFDGFGYKPRTTIGNMNSDICVCMIPHFQKWNLCDEIKDSPWEE